MSKARDIYYGSVRPTLQPRPAWMNDSKLLPRNPIGRRREE